MDETVTTKSKLTIFTSVAAILNKKTVKAKKRFSHYLGQNTDEIICPSD